MKLKGPYRSINKRSMKEIKRGRFVLWKFERGL
jgi:hypothetical protein